MKKENIEKFIKSNIFEGIPEDSLPTLFACLGARNNIYRKNEYIVLENQKFDGVGFVLKGEVSIVKESSKGIRTIITNFKEGQTFGEIVAFSGAQFWHSTVLAQSDCEIMFIHPEKILGICNRACDSHRVMIMNITRIISQKALILNRKVEYLTIKSMRVKIAKYLIEGYKKKGSLTFQMPLNREELADFLNVSRPSMSREFCKMRDEGILEFYRETVRIINLEVLKEILDS